MFDVDFALRIYGDAMRVAIDMTGGQFAPIVDGFVLIIARADNGQAAAGFIAG